MVKIKLDQEQYSARIIQSWIAPTDLYSPIGGSVALLPNGNYIGSFGYSDYPALVEVNMTSHKYSIFSVESKIYNFAFQFPIPQIIVDPTFHLLTSIENPALVEVFSSYKWNFREQVKLLIYINSSLVTSKILLLNTNWTPTPMKFNLSNLQKGIYNLTIVVSRKEKSQSTEAFLPSKPYFFSNNNSVETEKESVLLPISGSFSQPVSLSISVQQSLILQKIWTGGDVILNASGLPLGLSVLYYSVRNSTFILENGSITLRRYPRIPPQVTALSPQEFTWDVTPKLQLQINESSSYSVKCTEGNDIWFDQKFPAEISEVEIVLPPHKEGIYLFEILVIDELGLQNVTTVEVNILPPTIPVVRLSSRFTVYWGITKQLTWEVHGAAYAKMYREDKLIAEGEVIQNQFSYPIAWRFDQWGLGIYNVTLVTANSTSQQQSVQISVEIDLETRYATKVNNQQTNWVHNSNFSLGSPDGLSAEISFDYENGELTLEMGSTVLDTTGTDLVVYAAGGDYRVFVSQNVLTRYVEIGHARGLAVFDLQGQTNIKYVRIEYISGPPVLIDAVEGIKTQNSVISRYEDTKLEYLQVENTQDYIIRWNISDILGIRYLVLVDGFTILNMTWDGLPITQVVTLHGTGRHNVTLVAMSILGTSKSTSIVLDLSTPQNWNYPLMIIFLATIILIAFVTKLWLVCSSILDETGKVPSSRNDPKSG